MSERFKPIIKHDFVTSTYTIRDEKGIVIQVPDVIVDRLDGQFKTERDTLIDDLSWYKAKVSRLEQRHSKLVDENTRLQNELYTVGLNQDEADDKVKELERENGKLEKGLVSIFNMNMEKLNLLSEISQHIGNKPSSSTYKYFRAKLDGVGIKEGADDER